MSAKSKKEIFSILKKKGFSDFQMRVYAAALEIPRGRTRSYKWVAQRIKNPGAYRAVGSALNKNPYPVAIPCHRVIKSDGSVGGFSRGKRAKMRLLCLEGIDII